MSTIVSGRAGRLPRIGIVNLMPNAEQYENWLLPQLSLAGPFELQWIRISSRRYHLDDPARIAATYRTYKEATADAPLDGLIVSGAAVEHLPFEEVRFMDELNDMVQDVHAQGSPLLGLCWGAMGVGHLVYGLPKDIYSAKISGMYETELLAQDGPVASSLDDRFWSTHSRFAGFDDKALDASTTVRALARAEGAGTVIAESYDHSVLMHTGHPEYYGSRLAEEYRRDVDQQVAGVRAPVGVDLDQPLRLWRSHSLAFFASWVRLVGDQSAAR
ncbi:homoserine O-succinyltransferase [Streptomyces virginiae]|uniref:homoserine O-acetyltransferase/O-succinyltransferase family protein n=1 Tax=Streptomyces virginiae TaxID=1961 RepID=UPI0033AB0CD0